MCGQRHPKSYFWILFDTSGTVGLDRSASRTLGPLLLKGPDVGSSDPGPRGPNLENPIFKLFWAPGDVPNRCALKFHADHSYFHNFWWHGMKILIFRFKCNVNQRPPNDVPEASQGFPTAVRSSLEAPRRVLIDLDLPDAVPDLPQILLAAFSEPPSSAKI